MNYYDTFMKSTKHPSNKWRDTLQAFVDSSFENASTYYEGAIEEEIAMGTLSFKPIVARINSIVDAKTGQRVNDDYKKLIFPNLDYSPVIGTRYKFDDNIWIVFSTDNIKTDSSSVYVRRCNNVISIQDKYGYIHREPVYIDYKVTENQIFKEYSMDVPSGRIWFQCQLNRYTDFIDINDRYMFGNDVYKIRERSKFDRRKTFDHESVHTLSFYADYDNKSDSDNFELGIANYRVYDYSIDTISLISNQAGFFGETFASVMLDNNLVDEPIIWSSTDESIATINSIGEYKFHEVGKCEFICAMKNKPDVFSVTKIEITKEAESKYEDVLSPLTDVIKLNSTVRYSIYEYLNGLPTDTEFEIKFANVPNRNYRVNIISGNEFEITNLKPYSDKLQVICTNTYRANDNGTSKRTILNIRLGGIV